MFNMCIVKKMTKDVVFNVSMLVESLTVIFLGSAGLGWIYSKLLSTSTIDWIYRGSHSFIGDFDNYCFLGFFLTFPLVLVLIIISAIGYGLESWYKTTKDECSLPKKKKRKKIIRYYGLKKKSNNFNK